MHRFFAVPPSLGFAIYRQRWLNPIICSIGVSGSGAGNLFNDPNLKATENGSLLGGLDESASSTPLIGTLDAEITPETIDFFVSDAEGDPDCPSEGYSSIEQALNTLQQGKVG